MPEATGCKDSLVRNRTISAIAIILVSAAFVSGCGETEADTPSGCLDGAASFASSLRQAPGPVLLGGTTSISDCLVRDQREGDLVNFGEIAVKVANETGSRLSQPGAEGIKAAIDAGYLVGAMESGAEGSGGIHTTLVERVRSAATTDLSQASDSVKGHYEAGLEAGREVG